MRALFALLPSAGASEAEIRDAHAALEALDPSESAPSSFIVFAMHQDLHPAIRAYLLGLLELRLGEVSAAADRLETLAELEAGGPLVRNLTVELDAALARARGRPAEALSKLERARPELWYQLTVGSPFFTLASQRYLRAQLLEELGRPEEAVGWYRSIAERSPYEMVWRKGVKRNDGGLQAEGRKGGKAVGRPAEPVEWNGRQRFAAPSAFPPLRPSALSINRPHPRLVIPRPLRHALGRDLLDLLQIARRELHLEGADVFLEILPLLRPGDRHDVLALRQHPRERELGRRALLPPRDLLDVRHQVEVLLEVVALEARGVPAVVVGREVVEGAEPAGEEAAAQRAVGDEADAELAAERQDLVLGVARPERVLGLERGDRVNSRAARRIVSGAASERPRWRTLPARTRSPMAPTVSSIGTVRSTRCW